MKLSDGIIPFTTEWEAVRCGKITSSNMHKIFVSGRSKADMIGVGGMTYINQKIGEILTGVVADSAPETEDILRGQANEQFALERYSILTGETVHDSLLFVYNSIACGTTDGQVIKADGDIKAIIEAKCPRANKHIQVLGVDAPIELKSIDPQYYHQPQSNILLTGSEYADFVSYNDEITHYDLQVRIVRLYPDLAWQKEFVERIDWIADDITKKLEKILQAPERNLQYRMDDSKREAIEKLQTAIDSARNIKLS